MAELERSLRRLTGADFAVIPCNTAHHFLDKLRARTELPILDTIEETAIEAARLAGVGARIGLLATTGAIRTDLYQRAMARVDPTATILTPLDLDAERGAELQDACVMTPIYGPRDASGARLGGIKAGGLDDPARRERLAAPLRRAIELLREAGASVVILGCTEIPLVIERGSREGLTLLDPMQVAARACLDIASGARPLPAARSTCARFPDCV
jgi:aspartate racemase